MRATVLFTAAAAFAWGGVAPAQPATGGAKEAGKPTAAAEITRTKLLKTPVSVDFTGARLGDVLKELAAQVEMKTDTPVMWTYGTGFPYAPKVTYACNNKPLEAVLDDLFTKDGLGYIVISKAGDRRDGWVRLTTTGERGVELVATPEDEAEATEKLDLAKKLIDGGKSDQAKIVLAYVVKKYPAAKAATEAKTLLAELAK